MDMTMEWHSVTTGPSYLSQSPAQDPAVAMKASKIWGISRLPKRPDLWHYAYQELGACFIAGSCNINLLTEAAKSNAALLKGNVNNVVPLSHKL